MPSRDARKEEKPVPALVTFVDSISAANAIVQEDVDSYFNELQKLDIEIQLKRQQPFPDRESALRAYKSYLKSQVEEWTTAEKDSVLRIFEKVKELCDNISPRIFPGGIRLVKIKTGHYGPDVYYTRGRCIMIPSNIFQQFSGDKSLPIMMHEVFHIISRYNPQLRKDLYSLIGFQPLPGNAILDPALEPLVLTNPDGVSRNFAIKLYNIKDTILAVPVIKSKSRSYQPEQPSFFDYLEFDLYAVQCKDTVCQLRSTAVGKTTVPMSCTPSFFKKIKDNTQYIIHPDEIMADNFMLAAQAREKNDFTRFSKEGRELLLKLLKRLEQE